MASKIITTRVTPKLKRHLEKIAREERRTISQVVSLFLERGVYTAGHSNKKRHEVMAKAA